MVEYDEFNGSLGARTEMVSKRPTVTTKPVATAPTTVRQPDPLPVKTGGVTIVRPTATARADPKAQQEARRAEQEAKRAEQNARMAEQRAAQEARRAEQEAKRAAQEAERERKRAERTEQVRQTHTVVTTPSPKEPVPVPEQGSAVVVPAPATTTQPATQVPMGPPAVAPTSVVNQPGYAPTYYEEPVYYDELDEAYYDDGTDPDAYAYEDEDFMEPVAQPTAAPAPAPAEPFLKRDSLASIIGRFVDDIKGLLGVK